jgi:hypothetical protein
LGNGFGSSKSRVQQYKMPDAGALCLLEREEKRVTNSTTD